MVLRENRAYTSLATPRRDDANSIPVRVLSPDDKGKSYARQLRLGSPLDFGNSKFDVESLEQVRCTKHHPGMRVEFRAKGIDPVDCFLESPHYFRKLKHFLIRQRVNIMSVNTDPILPTSSSSAPKQPESPGLPQKPQFSPRSSASSAHSLLPSGPIVTASSDSLHSRSRTHDTAGEFFPDLETRPLAKVTASSSAAAKAAPKTRQRRPAMLSGDNSEAYKERYRRLSNTTGTKRPTPPSSSASISPARPSKKHSSQASLIADNQGALVQPTAEFISAIEKSHRPIKYKHSDGRTTHITIQDISRLQDKVFLDDSLISFFLKLYHEKMDNPESTHVFSTFFYPRIDNEDANNKWIQKIDFKTKNLLIIPVHQHAHWSAVVISGVESFITDQKQPPTIVYFDSLGTTHTASREVFKKCVAFLSQVFGSIPDMLVPASRRYTKLVAKVPVQSNLSDCGVFMLEFMRKVMENPEKYQNALALATPGKELDFSKVYEGTLNSRKDYLDILKKYGSDHPDLKAPSDGELSEIEVCDPMTV